MQRIGDYGILEKIGAGGMGEVWLAENVHTRMKYAIKLLPQEVTRDRNFVLRFFDEGRVMAELEHPHLVRVHHVGHDEGSDRYYLVMDYIEGPKAQSQSLHNALEQSPEKRLPEPQVRKWAMQIAEGLAYTHNRGVVHRDIKPANILIDKQGNARITDFGLVKVVGQEFVMSQIHQSIQYSMHNTLSNMPTLRAPSKSRAGSANGIEATLGDQQTISNQDSGSSQRSTAESLLGTYDYMSPEQRAGELPGVEVSPASDVYSFGVMLYRVLTGRLPTGLAKPPSQVVAGLPVRWDQIIARCLEHHPRERYKDAKALLPDLRTIGDKHAPVAPPNVEVPTSTPAPVPAQTKANLELVRLKITRWAEGNRHEWARKDWKHFVTGLRRDSLAEGLSIEDLEGARDEEMRAWAVQEKARKEREAAIIEERRKELEEIRQTERKRIAQEYRRAAEEARRAEEANAAKERRSAELEIPKPDDVWSELPRLPAPRGLLGSRPVLRAEVLTVLLTIAHSVGLILFLLVADIIKVPIVQATGWVLYHLPIAFAFWLAVERFRRHGLWILWTMLAGAGWMAFVLYADQPSLHLNEYQQFVAYNAWAGFLLAILFRVIDQSFSFGAFVMLVIVCPGSVAVAFPLAERLIAAVPPIGPALGSLGLGEFVCFLASAGLLQGISVGAVLVWAGKRARRMTP